MLQHPNVLPLYGFVEDGGFFQPFGAFISPVRLSTCLSPSIGTKNYQWRPRGDLAQYLRQHGESAPHYERLKLVSGLSYHFSLHSYAFSGQMSWPVSHIYILIPLSSSTAI